MNKHSRMKWDRGGFWGSCVLSLHVSAKVIWTLICATNVFETWKWPGFVVTIVQSLRSICHGCCGCWFGIASRLSEYWLVLHHGSCCFFWRIWWYCFYVAWVHSCRCFKKIYSKLHLVWSGFWYFTLRFRHFPRKLILWPGDGMLKNQSIL